MAPYLTPTDLRATAPSSALADVVKFPDALLADYVSEFEEIAEEYRGVAYIPRTATEILTLAGSTMTSPGAATKLLLARPKVIAITSVTLDGTVIASTDYRLDAAGLLSIVGIYGHDVTVVYTHGFSAPPRSILRACRIYVRAVALADRSEMGRDVIYQTADGMTLRYSTPNPAEGRPTGLLEVDRLLNLQTDYRIPGIG